MQEASDTLEFYIRSVGSRSGDSDVDNHSNDSNGETHDGHGGHANSGTVLFLFTAFAVGGRQRLL